MPEGTQITADDHGNVTVTYPDKSTDTIPGKDLVVKDDQGDHPSTNQSMADQITPNVPGDKVTVADVNQLTKDEKDKVKENVNKANPDLPQGTEVTVGNNGDVTITYPDKSTDTIPGKDLVVKGNPSDQPNTKPSDAHQITPNVPSDKVKVADVNQLTEDEKDKVKENVNKANPDLPQGTEVTIGDNGDVTITYPDHSTDVISGADLVAKHDQATSQGQPAVKAAGSHRPRRQASCHKLGIKHRLGQR